MLKSFKYKLLPNQEQTTLLNKHFGCVRFVYNHYLNERKREYETNKQTLNFYDNCLDLTKLKKKAEFNFLKEVFTASLQHSLKHLEGAYNGFFKGRTKFPKFKSKHNKNSYHISNYISVKNSLLKIPKFKEGIKMIQHKQFTGEIRQCTISKTPTNEYFISIVVETTHKKLEKTGLSVGIDLGIKDFVITSDGFKYKNNRYTKQYEKELKVNQQHLSRKIKGSNRYNKQRLKVAKIYKKITNSRKDNLHKVSLDLVRKYDTIFLEDLNIKDMIKNHKLSKHIQDCAWGTFITYLEYKSLWNDKQIVKIDRFFPSSKTCSKCGYINQNLKLDIREWTCPSCKTKHDRDFNAATNIKQEGFKIISSGTDDYRHGDQIRLSTDGTIYEMSKKLS